MEIQDLLITKESWFSDYKRITVESEIIQKLWQPAVGDWMERLYTLSMEPIIHKEELAIEMLCYKSTAKGYWHVAGADGKSRIWNSEEEIAKNTCKWIPRLDQLLVLIDTSKTLGHTLYGSIGEIHLMSIQLLIHQREYENPVSRS